MRFVFMRFVVVCLLLLAAAGLWSPFCSGDESADAWKKLPLIVNGKLAAGWGMVGWGSFAVDGEALRTEPSEKGLGLLVYTKERLGNCKLRVVYRCKDAKSNAGVFIRLDDGILKVRAGITTLDEVLRVTA